MVRAIFAAAICLAVLAGGTAWRRLEREPTRTPALAVGEGPHSPLRGGVPLCLRTQDERSDFVLPAGSGRHLLVIGSLGDPGCRYRVKLIVSPGSSPPRINGIPLAPWTRAAGSAGVRAGGKSLDVDRSNRSPRPGQSTFHFHVTDGPLDDARCYAPVKTREAGRGRHVVVLLDSAVPVRPQLQATAAEIVRRYEEQILPRTTQLLGPHIDVNRDGRLTVVLTPRLGWLQGGRTSLHGLVRAADFRTDLPAPFSNGCDVLFLNSTLSPGPQLDAVLTHEYAHVVTFSRRAAAARATEDDWLAEAIAHVSEHLHNAGWSNLEHRIAAYLQSPQSVPLIVQNYYEAGLWRNAGCRGATFLFLQWCVDQCGESLLRRLIDGEQIGVRNIEQSTGRPFDDLFRRWCLAVYFAGTGHVSGPSVERVIPPLRSVQLRGRLGQRSLNGPTAQIVKTADLRKTIEIGGTAAAFVEIRSTTRQNRHVRIHGSPGSRLQVTLVRLPDRT